MRKLTVFTIILFLAVWVSPASASSPPVDVQFVLDLSTGADGNINGPFVATGPAVDTGLMCPEGFTLNVGGFATPTNSNGRFTFHLLKGFICSGTNPEVDWFILRIDGKGDNITGTYNWTVWKASGIFAKLHGTGKATVDFDEDPSSMVDTLSGQLHID